MKFGAMKLLSNLLLVALLLTLTSAASIPSVIIVGAGMSGIRAGMQLHDAGIEDFLILEATDRIGGRIHKTQFAGYTVEKGANWLHGKGGPQKNPLYEMAAVLKLKTFYSDFDNISCNAYKQNGGLYPKSAVDAAFSMSEDTEDYGTKVSKQLSAENGKDDDMSLLALERLHKTEPKTTLEEAVDFFEFDGEQAESPRVTSLKHILPRPEFTFYGEDSFFVADPRGFESLVHTVAKSYLKYKNDTVVDPRIKFNQPVVEVDYTKDGVVTLKTEDGKVYQAQTVILSPSVGVLQSDLIKFNPQLPMWKRRAIDEFSLGVYTKIFLRFPSTFWPVGKGTEFFLYTHERRGYYAIWQHLNNEYPGANLLFVTVTDEESERIEKLSDEQVKAEAMEVLRKMFGKGIPEATDIMIPRWRSDRFFKGTFSNWPAGYTEKKHAHLRAPIGRVYFTGEHTHHELFGYADGAFFAGASTAKDVISCLKKKTCKGDYNKLHV